MQLKERVFPTSFLFFICVSILMVSPAEKASSQRIGIAHQDYMKAIGWEDDFLILKNILQNELESRIKDRPPEYYTDNANFFSMVLLLSEVKPIHYYKFNQNGVDVIHAITANIRPFDEQSLLSDVVVLGTVTDVKQEEYEDDGFDISVAVEVKESLKGEVPSDTIIIRQRNASRLPGSENNLDLGQSYLLLLSSGMYGYHKANHHLQERDEIVVSPPDFGNESVFVIYRLYPYSNGQLLRSPQPRDTAFRSLRFVDSMLRSQ